MTVGLKIFSQPLNDLLIKSAIMNEMVREDHWQGIEECIAFKPKALNNFVRYADAALNVFRFWEAEGRLKNGSPDQKAAK